MIEVKLLGPKDDAYALISLGGAWLATTKEPLAEAVKAAIAEAITKQANQPL